MNNKFTEISIIVPCLNEEGNILELVKRTKSVFKKIGGKNEIILVNDGSTDRTGVIINNLNAKNKSIISLNHRKNKGMAAAWKTGLEKASGRYVCLMDADLQYQPEDVLRLYRELKWSGVDMVQGWRSQIGRIKDSRYYLSRGLNFILNLLFSMHQKDNKSNFLLCRREVLKDIITVKFKYHYPQTFVAVAAKYKGYTVKEIEILFEERIIGKSFISKFPLKLMLWVFIDIIKAFFEFRILKTQKMDDPFLTEYLKELKIAPPQNEGKKSFWRNIYFKIYVFLMPFHHWAIDKKAISDYHNLKKSQWLSPEKIKELQLIKLKKIITHVYNHVAFYRDRMEKCHLTPDKIQSLEDLQKIPFLTENDIRENLYFDLLSDNHDKKNIYKITTSGSTGEPLMFYVDKRQLNIRWATTMRAMEWAGYKFGDRQIRLWHQTIGMTRKQIIKEKLDAFLSRRTFIPVYEMKESNPSQIVKLICNIKPVIMDGYAEAFNLLANYFKYHNIKSTKLLGIISSAQTLSATSRKIIENNLKCQVFDKYGAREFSGIAYECNAHQGHHVCAESYIVEIIKNGRTAKPGEIGEAIITDLNNYCVPMIRYRIGDLAKAIDNNEICQCRRGLPRIGDVEGRTQSIIVGSNGQYVPGTFFQHLIKDYGYAVKQFQIIQSRIGEINFIIIKGRRFNEKTLHEIICQIKKYLGNDLKINIQYAKLISLSPVGKMHNCVSSLNLDFQKINNNNE